MPRQIYLLLGVALSVIPMAAGLSFRGDSRADAPIIAAAIIAQVAMLYVLWRIRPSTLRKRA